MCGIAGMIAASGSQAFGNAGAAMLRQLQHRGPDDEGWLGYSRQGISRGQGHPENAPVDVMLLHRRLSILDLSEAGRQPMSSPDDRYHIVFNGEIYNYVELRRELQTQRFTFHTTTDTEVLLAAWAHWGVQALDRLVGMFAFAVLDTRERTVTLVRDFFGIKPLFYAQLPGQLVFASEIKALLQAPGISRRANPRAVYQFLRYGVNDHTPETCFDQIQQLASGHYLVVSLDRRHSYEPKRYWQIDPDLTVDLSIDEAAQQLRHLFLDSVKWHLRSDVPVGTALSGGIDSTSIVMGVRRAAGRAADLHSFSFIANGSPVDEERWVDVAARAAGTTMHKVEIAPDEIAADLDKVIGAQDEPFTTTSICAQYRVFRLAHEAGIKVLLDGQGADEMLAGYHYYLRYRLLSLLRRGRFVQACRFSRAASPYLAARSGRLLVSGCSQLLPSWLRHAGRRLVRRADGGASPKWLNDCWFAERNVATNGSARHSPEYSLRGKLMQDFVLANLPGLLRFEDRNSMHFSIESRVPFLTPQMVQFVFSLPEEYLVGDDATTKHVFRAAMRGIVPDSILARRDKIGFATPEQAWLRQIRPWIDNVLQSDAAHNLAALRQDVVAAETNAMLSGAREIDGRVWRWLNLIRWSDQLQVQF